MLKNKEGVRRVLESKIDQYLDVFILSEVATEEDIARDFARFLVGRIPYRR